jgi:hypothetical protein
MVNATKKQESLAPSNLLYDVACFFLAAVDHRVQQLQRVQHFVSCIGVDQL